MMPDQRHTEPTDAMDAMDRYWDGLMEGTGGGTLPVPAHLEPELAAQVDALQALGAVPGPQAAFVQRLRRDLFGGASGSGEREYPAVGVADGRVPADLLSRSLPEHQNHAARWSRRRAIAHLSTAALLLLTIGSIVLLAHSRRATTPPPSLISLNAPLHQPVVATTTLLDATLTDLPPGSATVWVEHWRFQPGPGEFTQEPLPESQVLAVESGRLMLTVDGQEQTITPGDQVIVPAEQAVTMRNAGAEDAIVILVTFPSQVMITPNWDAVAITGDEPIAPFPYTLPGGPVRVLVEQRVLSPGVTLPPEVAAEGVRFGTLEPGITLTLEGETMPSGWQAGKERPLTPRSALVIPPGTETTLRNSSEDPVVLYRVTLTPLAAQ